MPQRPSPHVFRGRPPFPPPVLFFLCLGAGYGLSRRFPVSLGLSPVGLRLAVAMPLFSLAFSIGAWAFTLFRRNRTSVDPRAIPSALITSGPFRFSRNPLYIAVVMTLAGFAAVLDSFCVACFVPVLALLLNALVVPHEEARLLARFGQRFVEYKAAVPRWL